MNAQPARPDRSWLRRMICAAPFWLLPVWGASADPALDARMATIVADRAASGPARLAPPADRAWIERVYAPAHPGPVWFIPGGPRPAIARALRELRAAADHGLAPEDYGIDALERLIEAASGGAPDPDTVARADVALSASVLQFLSDLRFGRVQPQRVEPHYRARAKGAAFVAELREAAARDQLAALFAAAEPQFPQYARLKRLLVEYRTLAANSARPAPDLPPLASPRSKVVVGDAYAGVPALHAELVRLGDLEPDSARPVDDRYSEALAEGLRRFQSRHGLLADGVLGKDTFAALVVPVAARIRQIVLSLERLRWLPDLAGGPLIAVNIPSFQLWAFADAPGAGPPTLSMPVVVGKAMRSETPVFIGEMRHVEFSPYWNVPSGILRDEILPRLDGDPDYLAREGMEIVATRGDGPPLAAGAGAGLAASLSITCWV